MAKHEFGIMDSFDENIWYNVYEPEKYDCISVSDDIIEMLLDDSTAKTQVNLYNLKCTLCQGQNEFLISIHK